MDLSFKLELSRTTLLYSWAIIHVAFFLVTHFIWVRRVKKYAAEAKRLSSHNLCLRCVTIAALLRLICGFEIFLVREICRLFVGISTMTFPRWDFYLFPQYLVLKVVSLMPLELLYIQINIYQFYIYLPLWSIKKTLQHYL